MERDRSAGADTAARQFVEKWSRVELSERAASHEHFLDLCRLLDQPTPASADATGQDAADQLSHRRKGDGIAGKST